MDLVTKAMGATAPDLNDSVLEGDSTSDNVVGLLNDALTNIVLPIAGVIAVIYLIYSGILYLTAAGNPESAKKGQQGVVNAIIGIIIIVLAYVIVNAVAGTAGDITG